MASFFIPLTGLQADSTALNTIANDLSNMNTTAFKSQTTSFSDLFYQQIGSSGSGDPIQVGAGVKVASNSTDFTQGSYNTSGMSASDMAIDGNGFFIVKDGSSDVYTRDGSFSQDTSGNLVTSSGLSVMGYPAANGVVNTSAPLAPISIPLAGAVQQPTASANFSMTANLAEGSTSSFPATVSVYDSLGAIHNVTITYTESTTTPNTWTYEAALPASDIAPVSPATVGVSTPISGTMTFNPVGGGLETINGATVGTGANVSSMVLDFGSTTPPNPLADGAQPLKLTWNLLGSAGTPTINQTSQTGGESTLSGTTADGNGAGTCTGFTVGSDGTVTATYTSGTEVVGQVALANMTNLQGLQLQGDGNYATTLASGTATVSASGSGGMGTIQDSALEQSNVNISSEFSDLIIAQRAFEANAKSVTTFDTVTQDTINMVH